MAEADARSAEMAIRMMVLAVCEIDAKRCSAWKILEFGVGNPPA